MSTWRKKAIELLPEQKQVIERSESPTDLWIELYNIFQECIINDNKELIKRIIMLAVWSTSEQAGEASNETHQAVYCGFLEDITQNKKNFPLFKQWFNTAQYEKYKGSFMYALDEKEYKELENIFYEK